MAVEQESVPKDHEQLCSLTKAGAAPGRPLSPCALPSSSVIRMQPRAMTSA